ncbi:hypothetical protein CF326_g2646 [Tilletia indica]|nr:hypothetical protein CF326_g2646 [Tilletia indica]
MFLLVAQGPSINTHRTQAGTCLGPPTYLLPFPWTSPSASPPRQALQHILTLLIDLINGPTAWIDPVAAHFSALSPATLPARLNSTVPRPSRSLIRNTPKRRRSLLPQNPFRKRPPRPTGPLPSLPPSRTSPSSSPPRPTSARRRILAQFESTFVLILLGSAVVFFLLALVDRLATALVEPNVIFLILIGNAERSWAPTTTSVAPVLAAMAARQRSAGRDDDVGLAAGGHPACQHSAGQDPFSAVSRQTSPSSSRPATSAQPTPSSFGRRSLPPQQGRLQPHQRPPQLRAIPACTGAMTFVEPALFLRRLVTSSKRVNVGGDTIHWTDTRGAGPLGPAMEIQLLMFSFKHLEGQVSTMQIAHVAQQMVPCLAAEILSHITGASLEDSEALIGDPQAVEYGRMVFPISAELLQINVQHAEVMEKLKRNDVQVDSLSKNLASATARVKVAEERVKELESKAQKAARIVEDHVETERQLNHFKVQHAEVTEKLKRSEMDAEKRHSDSDQYKDRAASDAVFSLRIQVDSLTRNLASASARAKVAEERVKAIESEVQKAAKIGGGHTERQADQNVRITPMNPLWRDAARYCIDPRTRTVGAGAHGKVRVLQDNLTRNRVAIKVVRVNQGGAIPQTVERELSFLASSSSDYVVPLLDVIQFVDGGDCYVGMVMPFYPRDLEGVIYDFDRDLTITDITYYATQILSGLDFLARRDIIHCDLKPANLLVTKNDHLFIADFGLAESRVQPQPRRVIASMNYRSPDSECYFRTMQRSQALDIWAFGVILMEMIGRAVPWDGSTPLDIFNQILQHTGVPYNAEIFPFATKLPGVFSGQDMHSEGPNPPSGEVKFNARPRTLPLSITMYGRGPRERFRDLFSVVDKILVLDPARRPAASRLLESPVFADSDPRGYRQLYPLTSELRASDVAEIRRTRRRM